MINFKDTILQRIEGNIPMISIDKEDLCYFDNYSVLLSISNPGETSLENFFAQSTNKIKEEKLEEFTNFLIIIFMTSDILEKLTVRDLQKVFRVIPDKSLINYGIYISPEIVNKLDFIIIGR